MTNDSLGDRCKRFELMEAGRKAMRGLPLIARLDGRAFHTFTRGLKRPYDERLSRCMIETTKFLVEDLQAKVGYTQSDEITLLWYVDSESASAYPFDGRFQKLTSIASGIASTKFYKELLQHLPEKAKYIPCFDCRVWQVPSLKEVLDVFCWREDDATKNSVSMAAQAYYSAKQLHGKNSSEKQELLWQKGINWNDYPSFFKRGTYVQRKVEQRNLSEEERAQIPEKHRPPEEHMFLRSSIVELDLPPIRRIQNASDVFLTGVEPILRALLTQN